MYVNNIYLKIDCVITMFCQMTNFCSRELQKAVDFLKPHFEEIAQSAANKAIAGMTKEVYILREINLTICDKAGCISDLLTEWEII